MLIALNKLLSLELLDNIMLFWQPAMGNNSNIHSMNNTNTSKKKGIDNLEELYLLDNIRIWCIQNSNEIKHIVGSKMRDNSIIRIKDKTNLLNLLVTELYIDSSIECNPIYELIDRGKYIEAYIHRNYKGCKEILINLEKRYETEKKLIIKI